MSVALLARWCRAALADLAAAREEIDALNVYPVPDSDTGTNLVVTMQAACSVLDDWSDHDGRPKDLGTAVRQVARAALLGAQGNSGVILAQLFQGAADPLSGVTVLDGPALARALEAATDAAYQAIEKPVEGTVLSVARAAGAAATSAASAPGQTLAAVSRAATQAAQGALEHTTGQLEVLRRAGVVDAGGRGLVVVLNALDTVVAGRQPAPAGASYVVAETRPGPTRGDRSGPAFEVIYLLDAESTAIPALRAALAPLGDSLVVVGGDGLWNVHVHVDDPGAAVEAGVEAGRPHRIRITHFGDLPITHPRGVVAVAAGAGLAELFGSAGASVVRTDPSGTCTTDELIAAIWATGAPEVVVLPNHPEGIALAEHAAATARADGLRVAVIPTRAQVQGLAACAVHEVGRTFDEDAVSMTAAAGHTRHGAVTVATRAAFTSAGACRRGDVLGVVEGDFAMIGHDVVEVGHEVVGRLLAGGGELVTVVTGEGSEPSFAAKVLDGVRAARPEVDILVYDGGQPRYPLLIGVE